MSSPTVTPEPFPQLTPGVTDPVWPGDGREKCLNLTHGWLRSAHGANKINDGCTTALLRGGLERVMRGNLPKGSFRQDTFAIHLCGKWLKVRYTWTVVTAWPDGQGCGKK